MLSQILLELIKLAIREAETLLPSNKTLKALDPEKVFAFMVGFFTMMIIISLHNYCSASD